MALRRIRLSERARVEHSWCWKELTMFTEFADHNPNIDGETGKDWANAGRSPMQKAKSKTLRNDHHGVTKKKVPRSFRSLELLNRSSLLSVAMKF
jgi:hypothetical protein